MDILGQLDDLLKQATEERSHYYVGHVVERAVAEIASLRFKHDLDHKLADKWFERIVAAQVYCGNDDHWAITPADRLVEVEQILAGNERAIREAMNEEERIKDAGKRGI